MDARWLLSRAGESGSVAMDAKRLLGRAGKSGQSVFGHTFCWSGCFRTPIVPLLTSFLKYLPSVSTRCSFLTYFIKFCFNDVIIASCKS